MIEDNVELCRDIRILLQNEGFSVITANTGEEGLILFDSKIDLVLLDVMLPGMSGVDVCREIRMMSVVPILFLTAKTEDSDKALGLFTGGDDYLIKPFSFIELIARIRALLRRSQQYSKGITGEINSEENGKEKWLNRGVLRLNLEANEVILRNQSIRLTEIEYQLLLLLARNPGMIFSNESIYRAIWDAPCLTNYGNIVTVHIRNLRKKIEEDPQRPSIIVTVWGKGYRFIERAD